MTNWERARKSYWNICHRMARTVNFATRLLQKVTFYSLLKFRGESFVKVYILLTVHLVRILGKWPTGRTILFYMFLFKFSTCFEQPRAHHQENQLYQYIIWYMALCVGDRFVCMSERIFLTCTRNGHRHSVTYTRCCIDTTESPDDEHEVAQNM